MTIIDHATALSMALIRNSQEVTMHTHEHGHRYIPAMGHTALTPLYDPFIRLAGRERRFKGRLIEHLRLIPGQRVLDVGCGTGTLAVMIGRARRDVEVTGIDGDEDAVARARRKAADAGVRASFRVALATELPFPDASFDRVTSTLMAHHLPSAAKAQMFAEIRRVLLPGGELHLVDIGPARSQIGRALQRLARHSMLGDNVDGKLPSMMLAAGLSDVVEEDRVVVAFGPLVFWRAGGGAPAA
jgi:ubiquinone/menaquinone biosynthesis C-methylase UbiE